MNAVDSEPVALVNLKNQTDQGRLLHEKTMARRRLLFVHCIIAFFVCSSLFSIVIDQEYWPFSPYGMYSGIQQPYFRWTRFFGITQDGEIPLPVDQYAEPFDEPRLKIALFRMKKHPNSQQLLNTALNFCLDRYEALRLAGIHDAPPLQGIRLYEFEWKLEAQARSKDQPPYKKLIYEMRVPDGKN